MYNIFVKGIDEPTVEIQDVVSAFSKISLHDDPMENLILKKVDKASYCDSRHFYDRNGSKTDVFFLSTGAKAALLVYHFPDTVVNCIEMGSNALSTLFKVSNTGNILIGNRVYLVSDRGTLETTIHYRGYCFSNVREFSDYFANLWPETPTGKLMEEYYDDNI